MSKKYIIEIEIDPYEVLNPDGITSKKLWKASSFNSLVFDKNGLDKLTPYDADSAYAEGYTAAESKYRGMHDDGYQRGLDNAWDAAKKIACSEKSGGYSWDELAECFEEECISYGAPLSEYRPEEAVKKIREYEERKAKEDAEIKVGDEVEFRDDEHELRFMVTCIYSKARPAGCRGFTTFDRYGVKKIGEPVYCDVDVLRKTGRHVDLSELFGGEGK